MAYATSKDVKRRLERAAETIRDTERLMQDIRGLLGREENAVRLEILDKLRSIALDIQIGAEDIFDKPKRKPPEPTDASGLPWRFEIPTKAA